MMIELEEIDTILLKSHRQGKISFYMTSFGETGMLGLGSGLN